MRIETLKTSKRKYFWCALVVGVVLLITIVLTTSMAKYQITESIKIAEGTINYKVPDLNLVAMYIENENGEYVETSEVPAVGYTLNNTSYCGQSDGSGNITNDTSITIEYNYGLVNFLGLSKKGTKCYLYFNIKPPTASDFILAKKTISTRDDFSVAMTADTTGTIYSAEDDDGTSYYFAGAPTDNYVQFAGFYWRIIRINGDGSVRLIYQGTSATSTGTNAQIGTSEFSSSADSNLFVGFMNKNNEVHGLVNSSSIKGVLDSWYDSNLASYASYIDSDAGFCNDRTPFTSPDGTSEGGGTGTTTTYYGAYIRLYTNKAPTLKCADSSDLFTVSASSKGNQALTNPIGLITVDEAAYAGGIYGGVTSNNNSSYYLYTGKSYWTMSPSYFNSSTAHVWTVVSGGALHHAYYGTDSTLLGVRPVINLKADTQFTGSGTGSDPYIVLS